MKLSTEAGYAGQFIKDIVPKDLVAELDKQEKLPIEELPN